MCIIRGIYSIPPLTTRDWLWLGSELAITSVVFCGISKPFLKWRHGWMIISHFVWMRLLTHTLDSRLVYVTLISYRESTLRALCALIAEAHIYEHELFVTFLCFHQGSLVAFLDNSIITLDLHVWVSVCLTIHKSADETRKSDPDRNVNSTGGLNEMVNILQTAISKTLLGMEFILVFT